MKFVTYEKNGRTAAGLIADGKIIDLAAASGGKLPSDLLAFIEAGDEALAVARKLAENRPAGAVFELSGVRLRAPLPRPPSLKDFFAFENHARAGAARRKEEFPEAWYDMPCYYKGNHREIYGPGDAVPWPDYTRRLDFECEVACVVGKKGRDLSIEEAGRHIFGYMLFNDFSARDIQKKEMLLRMGPAKGKDFANAFGPYLVTADEADPARDFSLTVSVNGEEWSSGRFADQHWGFPTMVSHVSQGETVYPGDVMGSGTFYKGCGLDLDRWIKPGDTVALHVPALGTLSNPVGRPDPAKQRELNYRKEAA